MKSKNTLLKEYKQKILDLKKHNNLYFNQDSPKITDQEYDALKNELIKLENKYLFLKNLNLSSKIVGAKPTNKFKKIQHLKPMLSLSNAFDKTDMLDFEKKIKNFLNINKENVELFSEPKIDGISATLIYQNGKLIRGLSRGDGVSGEDILENIKTIDASPKGFAKSVRQYGYLFQAAWYMTALRAMGERPKQFVFLVVEKSAPYATACYTLDNADIEREVPRVLEACKIYGECLRTDVWPGYSDDIKTLDLGTYYAKNRLSISQLAEKFGVSRSYAHRIIKKHNVVGQKLGKKRLIDMVEFSTALRWENTKKEVA